MDCLESWYYLRLSCGFGNTLLVKENVGLLSQYSIKTGLAYVVIIAIIPFTIETFAIAEVVSRSASTTLVHSYSIEIKHLLTLGGVLPVYRCAHVGLKRELGRILNELTDLVSRISEPL